MKHSMFPSNVFSSKYIKMNENRVYFSTPSASTGHPPTTITAPPPCFTDGRKHPRCIWLHHCFTRAFQSSSCVFWHHSASFHQVLTQLQRTVDGSHDELWLLSSCILRKEPSDSFQTCFIYPLRFVTDTLHTVHRCHIIEALWESHGCKYTILQPSEFYLWF